jgi:hypothetical protein
MRFDRAFRTWDRAKPSFKNAGKSFAALSVGGLLWGRASEIVSPDSQSLDNFLAWLLFLAAAYFGLGALWGFFRLWAESRPPSVPTHDFGPSGGFEDPKDGARGMRGDKL